MILRGPCPSDNPLFVSVNNSVFFQCDNEEKTNISGLSGSPFLAEEGLNHSITVDELSLSGNAIGTKLLITVREQYLIKAVNIQCGLCSSMHCIPLTPDNDRLHENVVSDPVILVAFSELHYV